MPWMGCMNFTVWIFDNVVGRRLARFLLFLSFHFSAIVWVVKWATAAGYYNIVILIIIITCNINGSAAAATAPDKYSLSIVFGWYWCWRVGAPSLCWFNRICVCVRAREVIIDHVDDARANYSNATRPVPGKRKSRTMTRNRQTTTTAFSLLGDRISRPNVFQSIKWDAFSMPCTVCISAGAPLAHRIKKTNRLTN